MCLSNKFQCLAGGGFCHLAGGWMIADASVACAVLGVVTVFVGLAAFAAAYLCEE